MDNWISKKPRHTIIITGDLNTRDKRFGDNHNEEHGYLDDVLLEMEIISDSKIPTRENNTLDITLAKQTNIHREVTQKVLQKLNSDHNPTQIEITLNPSPYRSKSNSAVYIKDITEYTVMDYAKTETNIKQAINQLERDAITLSEINQILRTASAVKTIYHKPIKFWTPELKRALKLQNKARRKIVKARKRHEDTTVPY